MSRTAMSALIVDDDEDMRSLVRMLLDLDGGIDVVGEASDACDGFRAWQEHRPDVLILDYRLPTANGLDVAEHILAKDPTSTILLFSAFLEDATVARAEALGVTACVSKDEVRRLPDLVHVLGDRRQRSAPASDEPMGSRRQS